MSDVEIYLDSNQPGQQLAVITKDGRQLIGASMAEAFAMRGQLMTTSNGFAAGASYSDAYLNGARQSVALSGVATGTQSFLGVAVSWLCQWQHRSPISCKHRSQQGHHLGRLAGNSCWLHRHPN